MKELLEDYKKGKITIKELQKKLESLPYKDLGFAKVDTHRVLRKGFPETVFCKGKTIEQIIGIIKTLAKEENNILATKATFEIFNSVKKIFPKAIFNKEAKTIVIRQKEIKKKKGKILIITGGTSDIPVAEEAFVTAELMGNKVEKAYDVGVAGVHRLLDIKDKIFEANVLVVVAGMDEE